MIRKQILKNRIQFNSERNINTSYLVRKNTPGNFRTYRLYWNGFLLKIKLIKLKYKKNISGC